MDDFIRSYSGQLSFFVLFLLALFYQRSVILLKEWDAWGQCSSNMSSFLFLALLISVSLSVILNFVTWSFLLGKAMWRVSYDCSKREWGPKCWNTQHYLNKIYVLSCSCFRSWVFYCMDFVLGSCNLCYFNVAFTYWRSIHLSLI